MRSRRLLVLALSALLTSGCSTGISGGKKYARFRPDDAERIETARASGEHFIVVRMAGTKGLARLPNTTRHLREGDRVGFTRDERGKLLAVAGHARAGLGPMPVGVTYIAWYYQEDEPLAEAGRKVRDGVGRVVDVAADAAAVAGVAVVAAAIDDALDDDDEDERVTHRRR